ncbi:MAG: DsbA family protein [Sphingomonas sp.]|nr:DsbA family protein [Sphingomonas sp.]
MPTTLSRRHAVQLGALVVGGMAFAQLLRRTAPIGRDVGPSGMPIVEGDDAPRSGPADATLSMAVFSDYRCPACRKAFPAMEEAVRRDGRVRIIYKDWPIFGPASERAANIAVASAEQGIYPTVHRRLMTTSRVLDDDTLRDILVSAGGDWGRATAWLATHAQAVTARLRANGLEAYSIGLTGTPGYLAGTILVTGAIDVHQFGQLFERARAAA